MRGGDGFEAVSSLPKHNKTTRLFSYSQLANIRFLFFHYHRQL